MPNISAESTGPPIISAAMGAKPNSSQTPHPTLPGRPSCRRRRARSTPARCIRRSARTVPATCPICGMALEPEAASEDSGPNPELADMTRRFWIGLALSLPVVVLEMGGHLFNLHMLIGHEDLELGAAHFRDAGRAVGGLSVLRARREIARHPQSQHVHADRDRNRGCLALQRRRDVGTGTFPAGLPRRGWLGRDLFRGGGGDHRSRAARPGAGAARARTDLAARSGRCSILRRRPRGVSATDGDGRGSAASTRSRRRSSARAAGRKSAGRRRDPRWAAAGRRVDGHRRIHAG